jgi:hypothetical protein
MKTEPKKQATDLDGVQLSDRNTLAQLLKDEKLHDLGGVAKITGLCVRYLRRLCHEGKVDHHRLLGRYYMTPAEAAALLRPVAKKTK